MFLFGHVTRIAKRVKTARKALALNRCRRRRKLALECLSARTLMAVDVLDQGFGFNGQTLIDFTPATGLQDTAVSDVTVDGKVVLAGRSRGSSDSSPFVGRLKADGSLDSAFGYGGFSSTRLVDSFDAVKTLPDGSILAAGRATLVGGTQDFAIVKFTSTGLIDKTFGNQGVVYTDFEGGEDEVNAIVSLASGEFFLVGTHLSIKGYDFAVAKYDSAGNLDGSFDNEGRKLVDLNGFDDVVADAAIDSLGRLVIAGTQFSVDVELVRLTPSGILDVTFSGDGKVVTDLSSLSNDRAAALTIGQGDVIYVAGSTTGGTFVLKYAANGTLATTFGVNGAVVLPTASARGTQDIVRDGSGSLFVSRSDVSDGRDVFSIVALQESNGSVVNAFGPSGDGRATAGFLGSADVISQNLLLRDNKLIGVASIDANVGLFQFFKSNGQLDSTFGQTGRVSVDATPQSGSMDTANAILELPNGSILAAGLGSSDDFSPQGFGVLARYSVRGVLDPTFAIGGRLSLTRFREINDIKNFDGQSVYVLGTNFFSLESEILRLDSKGNIDLSFGANGIRSLPIFEANKLALDSSGKIFAVGLVNGSDFGIVKLDATGNLDATFSGDGIQAVDFGGFDRARDIKLDSSSRLVVVGTSANFTSDIAVARLTATGVLDIGFNGSGRVTTDILSAGTDDEALSVALQAGGFVVVGGSTFAEGDQDSVLLRYTSAGVLSTTFDTDGIRIFDSSQSNIDDGLQAIQSDSTGRIIAVGTSQQVGPRSIETQMTVSAFNGTTGALDSTFDVAGGGTSRPEFGSYLNSTGNAIAISGARILAAGSVDNDDQLLNNFSNFAAIQLSLTTGLPVANFGVRSSIVTDFTDLGGASIESVNAIAAGPNGTSIVAGSGTSSLGSGSGAGLAKLRSDGTLDPTFGAGGRYYNPGFSSFGDAIILADGGVMATGIFSTSQIGVIKLLPNGEPDLAYGSNGIAKSAFSSTFVMSVAKMILLPNSAILVAGTLDASDGIAFHSDFAVVKFDATGNLDPTFDSDGMTTIDISGQSSDFAEDLTFDSSGKLVLSGTSQLYDRTDPNNPFFIQSVGSIVRMTAAGVLDIGFDVDGKMMIDPPGLSLAGGSLVAFADGSLAWGGSYDNKFLIARINSNGTFKTSFNSTGFAETILGDLPSLNDLVLDPAGRLLAVGYTQNLAQFQAATTVVAFSATSGAIDSTFAASTGGILSVRSFGFEEVFGAAAVLSGDKLLVASFSEGPQNIIVMRFGNSNPTLSSGAPLGFVENGAAVAVAPNSSISDANSDNFDGGRLTVTNTNPQAGDVIFPISTPAVSVVGSTFVIAGTTVGTFIGGLAGVPFVVSFNANASPAGATAVLRSIFYRHTTNAPSSEVRSIALVVSDGDGGSSTPVTTSISVTPVNDAPVVTLPTAAVVYVENAVPLSIFTGATITDVDSPVFTGGVLTITNTNGQVTDRLTLAPNAFFILSGNSISVSGQVFSTITGGNGTVPLTLIFTDRSFFNRLPALLMLIRFSNISESPGNLPRIFSVQITDGAGGTSAIANRTVSVAPVNDAPVVTLPTAAAVYVENAVPLSIFTGATITDVDTTILTGGVLTVTNTNGQAIDRLTLAPNAFFTLSGNSILVSGQVFSTIAGGSGTAPLTFTFTNQGFLNRVTALLTLIRFSSVSESPSNVPRIISVRLTDGAGGTSAIANRSVSVTPVNDAPVVTLPTAAAVYVENAAPLSIFTGSTITDVDTPTLTGGVLTITNTNGQATDRLTIAPNAFFTISGNSILVSGQVFSTIAGGNGTVPLTFTFTNQGFTNRVAALLKLIRFSSVSESPSNVPRIISVRLTDGAGGTSAIANRTVSVTPVNDAPVLGGIGATISYVRNTAPVVVAGSATVTDVDGTNFGGGKLIISATLGGSTVNRIELGGGYSVNASNQVLFGGLVVGSITSNGIGLNALSITFASTATVADVQSVARNVRFRTVSATAASGVRLSFTVIDPSNASSVVASKVVNVT